MKTKMSHIYNSKFTIRNLKFEIRNLKLLLLIFLILILSIPGFVLAEAGIASKYIGDKGIESDPDVVFAENFEEGSLTAVKARWEDITDNGVLSLNTEVPIGSSGKNSLLMTHTAGVTPGSGGSLYRRILPGYEQVYFRMYVKFDINSAPLHHFGPNMGGNNPSSPWPIVNAGYKPAGDKQFWTGVEPYGSAWRWDFYTYWMHMRTNPDTKFWGNAFISDSNHKVEKGKWICVELMMKVNNPVDSFNGEQALWIDGKLWQKDGQVISYLGLGFPKGKWVWDSWIPDPTGSPFEGFQWRTVPELLINYVWLYIYTEKTDGSVIKVWYDDVVVAKKYIGQINTLGNIPSPPTGLMIK